MFKFLELSLVVQGAGLLVPALCREQKSLHDADEFKARHKIPCATEYRVHGGYIPFVS